MDLPPGTTLELPGRGTTFVRHDPGPPDAPTLFLLHGWTATADLNWFPSYGPLAKHFEVVAMDHRGHGRGIRSARPVRLVDCADDVAAVIEELGLGPVIPVGYSMGGPIAQLLWQRRPRLVRGLVLCATSRNFRGTRAERMWFGALGGAAALSRFVPARARLAAASRMVAGRTEQSEIGQWAAQEYQRGDPRRIAEAGASLGRFTSHEWIHRVDVPTAVVVTERDRLVSPERQRKLAAGIPGATVHSVDGDHTVCVDAPRVFLPTLLEACRIVAARSTAPVPSGR